MSYPISLLKAFDIEALPILDLGQRVGSTGYIDFIQSNDMKEPIMRFVDCYLRSGIALKIKNKISYSDTELNIPKLKNICGVIVFFKRYSDNNELDSKCSNINGVQNNDIWTYASCEISDNILYAYYKIAHGHVLDNYGICDKCPALLTNNILQWSIDLLTRTDTAFCITD